jgi:hypothetical protein
MNQINDNEKDEYFIVHKPDVDRITRARNWLKVMAT